MYIRAAYIGKIQLGSEKTLLENTEIISKVSVSILIRKKSLNKVGLDEMPDITNSKTTIFHLYTYLELVFCAWSLIKSKSHFENLQIERIIVNILVSDRIGYLLISRLNCISSKLVIFPYRKQRFSVVEANSFTLYRNRFL